MVTPAEGPSLGVAPARGGGRQRQRSHAGVLTQPTGCREDDPTSVARAARLINYPSREQAEPSTLIEAEPCQTKPCQSVTAVNQRQRTRGDMQVDGVLSKERGVGARLLRGEQAVGWVGAAGSASSSKHKAAALRAQTAPLASFVLCNAAASGTVWRCLDFHIRGPNKEVPHRAAPATPAPLQPHPPSPPPTCSPSKNLRAKVWAMVALSFITSPSWPAKVHRN